MACDFGWLLPISPCISLESSKLRTVAGVGCAKAPMTDARLAGCSARSATMTESPVEKASPWERPTAWKRNPETVCKFTFEGACWVSNEGEYLGFCDLRF